MSEFCAICNCPLHRSGVYARRTVEGRSHATKHHFVAERFFGRSNNRRRTETYGLFTECPWGIEGKSAVFCYECHEELIHNPVLLPADVQQLSELVRLRGLSEEQKPLDRSIIASRICLFQEAISTGIRHLLEKERANQHPTV
jgi:hypothetical protein